MNKPNIVVLGLLILGAFAYLVATGHWVIAGVLILLSSMSLDDSKERFDPEP